MYARRNRPSVISAPTIFRVASSIGTASPSPSPATAVLIADHVCARVGERPAGVARVQRRVRLDHVLDDATGRHRQRAPERRDDAGRHRASEPERAADRDDELADAQPVGVTELGRGQAVRVESEHGEIGERIGADDL